MTLCSDKDGWPFPWWIFLWVCHWDVLPANPVDYNWQGRKPPVGSKINMATFDCPRDQRLVPVSSPNFMGLRGGFDKTVSRNLSKVPSHVRWSTGPSSRHTTSDTVDRTSNGCNKAIAKLSWRFTTTGPLLLRPLRHSGSRLSLLALCQNPYTPPAPINTSIVAVQNHLTK